MSCIAAARMGGWEYLGVIGSEKSKPPLESRICLLRPLFLAMRSMSSELHRSPLDLPLLQLPCPTPLFLNLLINSGNWISCFWVALFLGIDFFFFWDFLIFLLIFDFGV